MEHEYRELKIDDFPYRNHISYKPFYDIKYREKNINYYEQFSINAKPNGLWYGIKDSWFNNRMGDQDKQVCILKKPNHNIYELTINDDDFLEYQYNDDINKIQNNNDKFDNIQKNKILKITDKNYHILYAYANYIIQKITPYVKRLHMSTIFNMKKRINIGINLITDDNRYIIPCNKHTIWAYIAQDFSGIEFINTELYMHPPMNFDNENIVIIDDVFTMLDADSGCIWNTDIISKFEKFI